MIANYPKLLLKNGDYLRKIVAGSSIIECARQSTLTLRCVELGMISTVNIGILHSTCVEPEVFYDYR
jgi:hypothetical protein